MNVVLCVLVYPLEFHFILLHLIVYLWSTENSNLANVSYAITILSVSIFVLVNCMVICNTTISVENCWHKKFKKLDIVLLKLKTYGNFIYKVKYALQRRWIFQNMMKKKIVSIFIRLVRKIYLNWSYKTPWI